MNEQILPGSSFPLGASFQKYAARKHGVNFAVFAHHAEMVELLLFDRVDDATPARVITLDARVHETDSYWHALVPNLREGQLYGYRVHGVADPAVGSHFDSEKVLLDPYGRAVAIPQGYDRAAAARPGDNAATALKSVVADTSAYDWQGDTFLRTPFDRTVIYELHVAGFTKHPNSEVAENRRGTYPGLIEKIPYLQSLGITAVELMPVFQFDSFAAPAGHKNYWGYQPLSFFAPHTGYSTRAEPLAALDEFRDLVKALHRAGIEVILDVVFNHTAEGGADGPMLCYRGFANEIYYLMNRDAQGNLTYADYSGCGNTLNGNQTVVRRIILDSLRYWVSEMHVDGFRFDLASILSRDETGAPLRNPPVLLDIDTDPVLAGTKIIAEAWDAAGLYQVGSFAGERWKEWNGKFRDDIRSFLKGDSGTVSHMDERLFGSPDIYGLGREAERSINFVACHDGFTLNDVVSYNDKHNQSNGEDNRDGSNDNRSWNCGTEGPTDDATIEELRNRQVKNFMALTLLAVGAPMLLMGDEVRRTQQGNNNAYAQDNEISWFDWSLVKTHSDVLRFTRMLILQRTKVMESRNMDSPPLSVLLREAHIEWHGTQLHQPDWGDNSHSIAYTARIMLGKMPMHVMLNAYWEALTFELPPDVPWRTALDTARSYPDDIHIWDQAPLVDASTYVVEPRSVVVLINPPQ